MKLEQAKELVAMISISDNLGFFKKVIEEEKYTFQNNLIKYKTYCFYFKKKTPLFHETNLVQVDLIDNILKIYNSINGNVYYIGYFAKKKELQTQKEEEKELKCII